MAKDYFQFRQFTICQQDCAMKVGTDGTLLGAWASAPEGCRRILDIGTGTGLIALMMAQRFPNAGVTAIDIDEKAQGQALDNIAASPFSSRISVCLADVRTFADLDGFDAIVSNPPYFENSLECPDCRRTVARHSSHLTYEELMASVARLLSDGGMFSVIVPHDRADHLESMAYLQGLFLTRRCHVKTTPSKPSKRCLMEFRKHPVKELVTQTCVLNLNTGERSQWYRELTQEFYIK